jgi:DNA-binding transcriptional MerR regulator
MESGLSIQQVAQLTKLSIDTLRYYERIGLLEPICRAANGHRRYSERDMAWLILLIRLRDTGMPRAQMIRFAELRRQGAATATERRVLLEAHEQALESRMQELEGHLAALREKIARVKALEARHGALTAHDPGTRSRDGDGASLEAAGSENQPVPAMAGAAPGAPGVAYPRPPD